MLKHLCVAAALIVAASSGFATAAVPAADRNGSKDNPLLKRDEGSFNVAAEYKKFAEFTMPLSRLEPVEGKTVGNNNRAHEPKDKRTLEGAYTRLVYVVPPDRSPLEVLRNYQEEAKSKGGKLLFECKGGECGADASRSSSGGGGDTSLAMYLYPAERVNDAYGSSGYCAVAEHITDQRFIVAEFPDSGAHVSVLTYAIKSPDKSDLCHAFNGRTIAVVDIVEAKAREQRMVAVKAEEMASAISSGGRIALYGIYFDFNKADVKPESEPTLEQIAKLLKDSPTLKLLVVGHTDSIGSFMPNVELSQRRAAAVVNALATRFAIGKDRLTPVGVSFASPIESNKTEQGRAKNRRVELVDNA
jgi:outer membrane protein OmpA-like peptidoglycan-associated protein